MRKKHRMKYGKNLGNNNKTSYFMTSRKLLYLYLAVLLLSCQNLVSQKIYEPIWESLDSRSVPEWFEDAKFGIFIHWGLYSVPSYVSKGRYAEWYWNKLSENPADSISGIVQDFHNRVYGPDFVYGDFRQQFTCELFNPSEWAQLFSRSGARYVVLTSKHHDGYCLWPNEEASISYGQSWNSVESGPCRDLVSELTDAIRDEGLKFGLYYSLYEWHNPYWTKSQQLAVTRGKMQITEDDKTSIIKADQAYIGESHSALNRYIQEVMYPQFKEIVMNYQPALIFSDGDWVLDDTLYQTRPLLAWLFNNAPNRDEVVINDRWGKSRGKHGGYFTTEFGSGFEDQPRAWEETRGMGSSFGLNRIENIDDYRTVKELVFMLVDIVSRGGNLLLNVGPAADGTIPVIMQDRLIGIGRWLQINGEAIYGSERWIKDAQWSAGNKPEFSRHGARYVFPIYEMTIHPKPGNAVKEFYFTWKENTLYAISPHWPRDSKIFISDVVVGDNSTATLLGCDKSLTMERKNGGVEIDISSIGINDLPCNYMFTFRISGIQ